MELKLNNEIEILINNDYHPVFSIEDGTCLMKPGEVYEIWFRGFASRNFPVVDQPGKIKFVPQKSFLTFLYKKQVQKENNLYHFTFLYDNLLVYFHTTNRFKNGEPFQTYMIWFKKVFFFQAHPSFYFPHFK